ncbi:hypothetical protein BT63DRAFT_436670 [Microthyrium microscopicum]|uniref:Ribosomal protein S15 n=1 Tax=Microthyrium microscopicum TaxID=703497 RepID=A0A6A6UPJ2_9PEZI|nr:hypothetical protein BT63DRAFT_436670 [Microthyrium microscopicum]
MPPRIPVPLRADIFHKRPCRDLPIRTFTSYSNHQAATNQYVDRQKQAHSAALKSRGKKSKDEPPPKPGTNPVRGLTTRFLQSFDPPKTYDESIIATEEALQLARENADKRLNFHLTQEQLDQQLARSKHLTSTDILRPEQLPVETREEYEQRMEEEKALREERHQAEHERAKVAIERIVKLEAGNLKDLRRVNIQTCIQTFGRHNTDAVLAGKDGKERAEKFRAGVDVGSSEVQIAVLTAKIRNLANFIQERGHKDHHNKRNLRLMVHKRQKLLKYLVRKERGGPRWQNLIRTLGLTEATWKGEIVV